MDRSRSSSRDRSPRRKHRKRKHKSRRSRSRTRSRSRDREYAGGHRIHVNPAFGSAPFQPTGPPQMGYSASQLVQQNNALEAEVMRLNAAVLAEQGAKQIEMHRNQMQANEMRNLSMQRDNYAKRCNEMMDDRRCLMDAKAEMAKRLNGLDVANQQLREDSIVSMRIVEAKNEEIVALQYQADIVQKQIAGLNERNATLKAKCESTVETNKRLLDEIKTKNDFYESARLNSQKAEADLLLANNEIKRLLNELESSQNLKDASQGDVKSIEEQLAKKDNELRVANFKSEAALKSANETIEKLESRLKSEKPAMHNDLAVEFQETIYMAIETMKSTYERQLARLEEEVEALRNDKLRDHGDEGVEDGELIEELPDYLQTPRKPDPAKMDRILRTNQVKINLNPIPERSSRATSGPPMDSPVTWSIQKSIALETSSVLTVPLFGTTGIRNEDVVRTEEAATSSESIQIMTSDELLEEELLGGAEMISPTQNLELMEKQLLDEP